MLTEQELFECASNWDCGMRDENEEWRFSSPQQLMLFYKWIKEKERQKELTPHNIDAKITNQG